MRSKRPWLAVLAALTVAVTCWHASRRVAAGPDAGVGLAGQSRTTFGRPTIRIATFNIHSGKGRDGRRDLDRTARCLEGFDLIGLNEVRAGSWPHAYHQAESLGRRLGMAWLFAPAERQWYGCRQFGNGLLGRMPLTRWQRIPLPRKFDRSFRNLLLADIRQGNQTVHLLVTHVCRRDERERRQQLDCVLGLFLALEEPTILVGDLNSRADDPAIHRVLATPGVVDAIAQTIGESPTGVIDWILVRGLRPVDGGKRDDGASDHPLFWAELELIGREHPG